MKKITYLLLTLLLIFSLSACSGKTDTALDSLNSENMSFAEFEWPDTDIAQLMPMPKSNIGSVYWSEDYGFVIYVAETPQDDFAAYVEECRAAGFLKNVNEGETWYYADNVDGYHISLQFKDDDVMFVRIDDPAEPKESVVDETSPSVDILEPEPEEIPESAVTPKSEPEQTLTVENEPIDTTEPIENEKPVYYSTNTFEEAKNGNSGIFTYKRDGNNYDFYWIIDFDEGYAYSFTYGNNSTTCERVQIEEGDLNSYVVVTYHDGDSSWQYGLCFKRVSQPDRLIQSELDGTQYEFMATSLQDALKLRDEMEIVDY